MTWILWPLLIWTWWCWRRDRWAAGAIGLGLALSLKIFLGVFLLWLVLKRQWRALPSRGHGTAAFGVGVAVYGTDVFRAWIAAMAGAEWPGAFSNASIRGLIDRSLTKNFTGAPPLRRRSGVRAAAVSRQRRRNRRRDAHPHARP